MTLKVLTSFELWNITFLIYIPIVLSQIYKPTKISDIDTGLRVLGITMFL